MIVGNGIVKGIKNCFGPEIPMLGGSRLALHVEDGRLFSQNLGQATLRIFEDEVLRRAPLLPRT